MRKAETLARWRGLQADQAVKPVPVMYKHQGSTYTEDSIRITGTQEFIDSVLSRLMPLLEFENTRTRLQLVYQETTDKNTGCKTGTYNCYVQVHQRGGDAIHVNETYGQAFPGMSTVM